MCRPMSDTSEKPPRSPSKVYDREQEVFGCNELIVEGLEH